MRLTITAFCLTVFFAAFPVHVIGQEKVGGAVTVTTPAATFDPVALYGKAAKEKWEETIQKMEAQDRQEKDPENGVLLIGSSSIRLWETASEDLAPFPVIPRGYGGARYSDLAVFIDRIIKPHRFRACVMFVGNDVTGSKDDRTLKKCVTWCNTSWPRSIAMNLKPKCLSSRLLRHQSGLLLGRRYVK